MEENLNEQSTPEVTSDTPVQENAPQTDTPQVEQPSLVEIDSLEKFKFAGRELTPKELQSMILMQSDYTRKTQSLAEERKYMDNLQYDLDKVKMNPNLADQFKQVYPEKYHKYLDYLGSGQALKQESVQTGIDPALLSDLKMLKQDMETRKVQAAEKEIDAVFDKYTKKFPYADEEVVISYAQSMLSKGQTLNDQVWENIFKFSQEKNQKLADKYYSEKVSKQQSANEKGKDSGAGGGIPGQAPRQFKTLKEAHEAFLKDIG